jgi:hypothetical protein
MAGAQTGQVKHSGIPSPFGCKKNYPPLVSNSVARKHPIVLILTPTRELAIQVEEV